MSVVIVLIIAAFIAIVVLSMKTKSSTSHLWHIHGRYYDFSQFVDRHPGGQRMLLLGQNSDDCTALFESVHLFSKGPHSMLAKYEVDVKSNFEAGVSFNKQGFYMTAKARVQAHFEADGQRKTIHGTGAFWAKLAVLFPAFLFLSYHAVIGGHVWAAFIWGSFGLAMGGYGHESLHGGVFSAPWKNRLCALMTMDIVGISSQIYSVVHSTGHHVNPNVPHLDPDLEVHWPLFREFEYQPSKPAYKYQHIYAWIIYLGSLWPAGLLDIAGVLTGQWNIMRIPKLTLDEAIYFWSTKTLFYLFYFVLPFAIHPFWVAIKAITLMWFITSFMVNLNFALSHQNDMVGEVTLDAKKPMDWGELQVRTSSDYVHGNQWFDMMTAGLGYQVEHHLFPCISYSRLHEIAPIVRATCVEFDIPYLYQPSYFEAIKSHYNFLRDMGNPKLKVLKLD